MWFTGPDIKLGRTVALKFPAGEDTQLRERFFREARAAASLNHSNIATVYEVDDEHCFLAMEFVEGESLKDKIARRPLPLREALDIGSQIVQGLQAAHDKNVVHRDIKPGNILIAPQGQVKVTDFGLAQLKDATQITITGSRLGTPAYMSPEQAQGEPTDRRTDIWSTGAVLYEMVSGRPPFKGNTEPAVVHAILHEEPEALTALRADLPLDLDRIVRKALSKNPQARYQHAEELHVDLRALTRSLDLSARSVQPSSTDAAKHRRGLAIGMGIGIVAAVVSLGSLYLARDSPSAGWVIKPLTAFNGMETEATWSPDGTFVAYSHTREGQTDIFVKPVAGGNPVQLTHDPADDFLPRWSPDGKYLAFASDRGGTENVYLTQPLGGPDRKLVDTALPGRGRRSLGGLPWSPDSQYLLFSRYDSQKGVALWKMHLVTGQETQMTFPQSGGTDIHGAWSFDNRQIVFQRLQRGRAGLWLLSVDGGSPTPLLVDSFNNSEPVWSADSKRVVFVSDRAGAMNLWQIDIASRGLRQLTVGPGGDRFPVVSRGGLLAFDQFRHQTNVHTIQLAGLSDKPLPIQGGWNTSARFSPNGRKVLYQSNRTGNPDLWSHDLDSGSDRQLTNHPGRDAFGSWFPDGRSILFTSDREGGVPGIWTMNTDGGGLKKVSGQPFSGEPRVSPDGTKIGFLASTDKGTTLWIMDRQGKADRTELTKVLSFVWYRDNTSVLYTRQTADGASTIELRAANLETGDESVLAQGTHNEMAVAGDGSGVTYCHGGGRNQQLFLLRLDPPADPRSLPRTKGKPEQLTHGLERWHAHNGGWSPDARSVIYTRATDEGDIYVIENYR